MYYNIKNKSKRGVKMSSKFSTIMAVISTFVSVATLVAIREYCCKTIKPELERLNAHYAERDVILTTTKEEASKNIDEIREMLPEEDRNDREKILERAQEYTNENIMRYLLEHEIYDMNRLVEETPISGSTRGRTTVIPLDPAVDEQTISRCKGPVSGKLCLSDGRTYWLRYAIPGLEEINTGPYPVQNFVIDTDPYFDASRLEQISDESTRPITSDLNCELIHHNLRTDYDWGNEFSVPIISSSSDDSDSSDLFRSDINYDDI